MLAGTCLTLTHVPENTWTCPDDVSPPCLTPTDRFGLFSERVIDWPAYACFPVTSSSVCELIQTLTCFIRVTSIGLITDPITTWLPQTLMQTLMKFSVNTTSGEKGWRGKAHTSMTSIECGPFERATNSQWVRTKPAFQVHLDWCNKIDTWSRLNSGAPVT